MSPRFEEVREKAGPAVVGLIQEIWDAYKIAGEWPNTRRLLIRYGSPKVLQDVLNNARGLIEVYDQKKYGLSFVAILLTGDGEKYFKWLGQYLALARGLYFIDDKTTSIKSAQAAEALNLSKAEVALLGRLIRTISLFGSGSFGENEWECSLPEEVEKLEPDADFALVVEEIAFRRFDPKGPVSWEERMSQFAAVEPSSSSRRGLQEPDYSGVASRSAPSSKKVFLVHGHDGEIRETAARFLERLDLEPIILHEQPNKGQTIIEKLDANSEVSFAVVLLTGDDKGSTRSALPKSLKPRARQNVILELGYFIGRLGRTHVCALYEEGVEIPSDFDGVVYVPLDPKGAWRFQLAREIKAAGIEVDLNKAL